MKSFGPAIYCGKAVRSSIMSSRIDDPKRWRNRADEVLAIADQMKDPECKRILVGIAQSYAELARNAEARRTARPGQR